MNLTLQFQDRETFKPLADRAGVAWRVEQLRWRAVGGPWQARIRAQGELARLWELADLLRCGVQVQDAIGPAWWGYVSALTIHAGARALTISLDEMANRACARYRVLAPTGQAAADLYAPWQSDGESQRVYGVKEQMLFLDQVTSADPAAYTAAYLRQRGRPRFQAGLADSATPPAPGETWAELECRGWWQTLDWKYYAEPRGAASYAKGASLYNLGSGANLAYLAWFVQGAPAWRVGEAWFKLRRVRLPTMSLQARIWANNNGVPGAVQATSASIGAGDVDEELRWTRFVFPTPFLPAANTTYWLGVRTDGPANASHHYQIGLDAGLGAPDYTLVYSGSSFSPPTPDADMPRLIAGVEDTAAQIASMLGPNGGGQFFSGVRVEGSSGVLGRLYREGRRTTREEVEELLAVGAAGGPPDASGRLIAEVTPTRLARVYPQPAPADPSAPGLGRMIGPGGEILREDGQPLALSDGPAGQWARLGLLAPPGSLTAQAGRVFIENATWSRGVLRVG